MQVVESYLSRVAREAGRLKLPDKLPLAMREFWWEHCADAAVGFDTLFRAVSRCAAVRTRVRAGERIGWHWPTGKGPRRRLGPPGVWQCVASG